MSSCSLLAAAQVAVGQSSGPEASAADGAGRAIPSPFDDFVAVTDAMLERPDAADWLMYSRTYDAQRFSPLAEIDRGNVGGLAKAWTMPLPEGVIEIIPDRGRLGSHLQHGP